MYRRSSMTDWSRRLYCRISENKDIVQLVHKLKESRYILLKNFDVFKAYIYEKMIVPLNNCFDQELEILNKMKISVFEELIKNRKFYDDLIVQFPLKIKHKQKDRFKGLAPNLNMVELIKSQINQRQTKRSGISQTQTSITVSQTIKTHEKSQPKCKKDTNKPKISNDELYKFLNSSTFKSLVITPSNEIHSCPKSHGSPNRSQRNTSLMSDSKSEDPNDSINLYKQSTFKANEPGVPIEPNIPLTNSHNKYTNNLMQLLKSMSNPNNCIIEHKIETDSLELKQKNKKKIKLQPHLNNRQKKKFLVTIAPNPRNACFTPSPAAKICRLRRKLEDTFLPNVEIRNRILKRYKRKNEQNNEPNQNKLCFSPSPQSHCFLNISNTTSIPNNTTYFCSAKKYDKNTDDFSPSKCREAFSIDSVKSIYQNSSVSRFNRKLESSFKIKKPTIQSKISKKEVLLSPKSEIQ